jgi:NADH-quinone oxidoreductase subunit E
MPTPESLEHSLAALAEKVRTASHPRELVVDAMLTVQERDGHLSDAGLREVAEMVGMSPLEVEELATFYTFIYREPVGKYVIHVCDSVICWMDGADSLRDELCRRLGIAMGETTPDGLFTLLPVCCIGYCDRSPAILVNRKAHGPLTPESLDALLDRLRAEAGEPAPGETSASA